MIGSCKPWRSITAPTFMFASREDMLPGVFAGDFEDAIVCYRNISQINDSYTLQLITPVLYV